MILPFYMCLQLLECKSREKCHEWILKPGWFCLHHRHQKPPLDNRCFAQAWLIKRLMRFSSKINRTRIKTYLEAEAPCNTRLSRARLASKEGWPWIRTGRRGLVKGHCTHGWEEKQRALSRAVLAAELHVERVGGGLLRRYGFLLFGKGDFLLRFLLLKYFGSIFDPELFSSVFYEKKTF